MAFSSYRRLYYMFPTEISSTISLLSSVFTTGKNWHLNWQCITALFKGMTSLSYTTCNCLQVLNELMQTHCVRDRFIDRSSDGTKQTGCEIVWGKFRFCASGAERGDNQTPLHQHPQLVSTLKLEKETPDFSEILNTSTSYWLFGSVCLPANLLVYNMSNADQIWHTCAFL